MQKKIWKQTHVCCISIVTLLFFSCSFNKRYSNNYKFTTKISENLYIETYSVFGSGAYGGDINMDIITDSLTFRVIVGKYDNYNEFYNYKCNGDSIKIVFGMQLGRDSTKIISSKKKLVSELSELNNLSIKLDKLPKIFN
jgi:hypothetical protein